MTPSRASSNGSGSRRLPARLAILTGAFLLAVTIPSVSLAQSPGRGMERSDPSAMVSRPDHDPSIDDLIREGSRSAPGKTRVVGGTKILGGTVAKPGQWKSMVALFLKGDGLKTASFCGGTVIDRQWVLTAAHCAVAMQNLAQQGSVSFFIREGTINISKGGKDIAIDQIVPYDGYDPETTLNDMALLHLASPSGTPPQALIGRTLFPDTVVPPKPATVVGYGTTTEGGTASAALRQVDVPIVGTSKCKEVYGDTRITDANFCAGGDVEGRDSCQGDSGGPIYMPTRRGSDTVQVGVVSWGKGCGQKDYPGVYSSVSSFQSWIEQNVPAARFVAPEAQETPKPVAEAAHASETLASGGATEDKPSQLAQLSVDIVQGAKLKVGGYIDVKVVSSVPGTLTLFNQDSDGRAYQIYPSKVMPAGGGDIAGAYVRGGETTFVPSPKMRDQGFRFRVTPPTGRNWLIAMVLPDRLKADDLLMRHADGETITGDQLTVLINEMIDREHISRGLDVVKANTNDRATARLEYEIVD